MKLRLNKFYGYVSVFILITLIVILLFCVYKSTRLYEGLAPVSASAPETVTAPATAPSSSSENSDNSAKAPSVATFDVNSAASFALLAEGEMLNPPPSASPISSAPPTNWYQPDSFRVPFSPSDTTDQIFMNQSTNLSQVTPVKSNSVGFCTEQSNYPLVKESKCNALSNETCASTGCCVLLGGEKCVAGNEQGPLIETNYSNFLIKNRDYYYYQGKCYGNCGNQ